MEGIHYLTDDKNKKIAVQIDLKRYGEIWDDIEDYIICQIRKDEEKIPWEDVKKELKQEGKL